MKLTEEQAKEIVAKVHKDLNLDCNDKYPIIVNYFEKDDVYKKNYWAGRYDYSKTIKGVELERTYPYDFVNIDDEKGVGFSVSFFPEDSPIKLDENGKYVWGI